MPSDPQKERPTPAEGSAANHDAAILRAASTARGERLTRVEILSDRRGARTLRLRDPHGTAYVLKIATDASSTVAHEAQVLRALGPAASELWLADGRTAGRDWLLQRWIVGRPAHRVAAELREQLPFEAKLRRIARGHRRDFASLGRAPDPAVEALLAAGLATNPQERAPTMREYAAAWERMARG